MPRLKIKKACNDCPFRRDSRPGWLGADNADNFVRNALADISDHPLPCHLTIDYEDKNWQRTQYPDAALCAGALIFTRNNCKSPRDPERNSWVQSVEMDPETVFSKPWEFYIRHGEEIPDDYLRMMVYAETRQWLTDPEELKAAADELLC